MVSQQNPKSNKIGAKKSLGQNFLHNKGVITKMVSVSNVSPKDIVVEIGPGKGALTGALLNTGAHVIAIEKDSRLIPILNETFKDALNSNQLKLLHTDALVYDFSKIKKPYKVIANIPYYITGGLLRHFFDQKVLPKSVTVLVQKEVADRIVASNKKESILSLSIKFFGTPKKIMNVSKNNFNPKPKVDSAVLFIETHEKQLDSKTKAKYFDLLHRGFGQKRKTLRKNLIGSNMPLELIDKVFAELKIDPKIRAEDINAKIWLSLANKLY